MPSFKNTFGKEETDKNLTYDNTAFLHFTISLSVVLIALLVYILVYRFISDKQSKRLRQVKSSPLFSRQVLIEKKLEWRRIVAGGVINKILLIVGMIILAWLAMRSVNAQGTKLKGFDPYELLGVGLDTPVEKIRKAYRKLAFELHPDLNPNNPEVAAKFILVSKAYECLTDVKVKANCQKYGNPDGQQSFKVGIALPSFLIRKQNHIVVMCCTFVVILLVIPKLLMNWNFKLQAKDDRGVLIENYQIMYQYLRKKLTTDRIDNIIVSLKEVDSLQSDNQQPRKVESNQQVQQVKEELVQQQPKVVLSDQANKNLEILRLYREGKLFEAQFIQKTPDLIREIIVFSLDFCIKINKRRMLFMNEEGKKVFAPFIGVSQYDSLIKYSQEFYQNSKRMQHGLNQLSLSNEKIEELKNTYYIYDILKSQQKRDKFLEELKGGEHLKRKITQQIQCLPCIDFKATTFAGKDPETIFTNNDYVTFKFTINRNLQGNPAGIAYIPKFPYLKQEKYYLSLEFSGVMVFFEEVILIPGQTYEAIHKYVHRGPPQKMIFKALLCSDCYFGLDHIQNIELTFNEFTGNDLIEFHPVDKRLEYIPMNQIEGMLSFDINGAAEDELLSDSEETAVGNEQIGRQQMHEHQGGCCDHNHEHKQDNDQQEEHVHGEGCQHSSQPKQEDPEEKQDDEENISEQSK